MGMELLGAEAVSTEMGGVQCTGQLDERVFCTLGECARSAERGDVRRAVRVAVGVGPGPSAANARTFKGAIAPQLKFFQGVIT